MGKDPMLGGFDGDGTGPGLCWSVLGLEVSPKFNIGDSC